MSTNVDSGRWWEKLFSRDQKLRKTGADVPHLVTGKLDLIDHRESNAMERNNKHHKMMSSMLEDLHLRLLAKQPNNQQPTVHQGARLRMSYDRLSGHNSHKLGSTEVNFNGSP